MAKKKKRQSTKAKPSPQKKPIVSSTTASPYSEIPTPTRVPTSTKWLSLLVFVILSLIIYGRATSYDYVLDDKLVYTENDYTKGGFDGIGKLLSTESFTGYFKEEKNNLVQGSRYRPLSLISFNLEHSIFGTSTLVSHLINILLYALTVWVIFLCLYRLLGDKIREGNRGWLSVAMISAVIFLVHPLHVEAVANVKGRDEILSMLLSMLSFWAALKYVDTKRIFFLAAMLTSFFLGLLAKENTLTFLAIIPFGIYLFRKAKGSKKDMLLISLVLLLTSIAYLFLRYSVIGFLINDAPSTDVMNNSFAGMSGTEKYATIFYTLLHYLKLNVFPYPLTHDYYPYHIPISNFGDWQVLLSIVLHIVMFLAMFVFWKKKRVVTFAIGFYFACMSIVSNLVISIGTFMNERFAFAASLGSCLLLASALVSFPKKGSSLATITRTLAALLILAFALLSALRVPAWESELALNTAAIKVSKNSARSNSFMATALFNKYKETQELEERKALLEQAQPYARKAVEILPTYYNGNLMKVGIAAEKHKLDGNLDNLLAEFHEVMMIRPDVDFLTTYLDYIGPREDKNKLLNFYERSVNMMMNDHQRYDWSVKFLNSALAVDQNDPELRSLMRKAYAGLGQLEKANLYR